MITIFEQGSFHQYSLKTGLDEARSTILAHSQTATKKTTVFLSHKHDDLDDLKDVIGFLQKQYGVQVYIDSRDSTMPSVTSSETALKIRNRIDQCDKFILLATNGAISSKWCNWELGYGDARKFQNHIALFPFKPKDSSNSEYRGSEYMTIYPYISYFSGDEKYKNGKPIPRGYYIRRQENGTNFITPLDVWFKEK